MWISRKKWKDLESRVADLEKAIQSQPSFCWEEFIRRKYEAIMKKNMDKI